MQWIKSGPDWIARGDERFNVEAKSDDPAKATEPQLLAMLQALLVERFQMKFHRETIEAAGFVLTIGKSGPKLQSSKADDTQMSVGQGKPMPASLLPCGRSDSRWRIW